MSGDAGNVVAGVSRVFDVEAGLAGDAMASDPAQEFCAFARKHWANDQLEEAPEFRLVVLTRRQFLLNRETAVQVEVVLLTEGLLQFELLGHGGTLAHGGSLEFLGECFLVTIAILLHLLIDFNNLNRALLAPLPHKHVGANI